MTTHSVSENGIHPLLTLRVTYVERVSPSITTRTFLAQEAHEKLLRETL